MKHLVVKLALGASRGPRLSGTPFKALATGEFIEEQIFNWTYADEQRSKEEFALKNPGKWNPYGALPQMRLLTYRPVIVNASVLVAYNRMDHRRLDRLTQPREKPDFC